MQELGLQTVGTLLVSLGFATLWVKSFGLAEESEPWIPWQWWHDVNWRHRWGIFAATNVVMFLVISVLGVWPKPQHVAAFRPMGESIATVLTVGFFFSFALLDAAAILVLGYAALIWLSEAASALEEKRDES